MSEIAQGIRQGDWYAFCQVCGRRFFGSTLLTRYDGLFVCDDDFENRHPQEQLHSNVDQRTPPFISTMDLSDTLLATPLDATTSANWYTQ